MGFVVLGDLVDVVLVLVFKLVDLKHGLDTGVSPFRQDAQTYVTRVYELIDLFSSQVLALLEVARYVLNNMLFIVFQVDAYEVLVFDEPPALLDASLDYPDLTLGEF